MRKVIYLLILIPSITFAQKKPNTSKSPKSPTNVVNIEMIEEINSPQSFSGYITPFTLSTLGNYLFIGAGGSFNVSNVLDKYSVHAGFYYDYGKYNFNDNPTKSRSYDYNSKKSTTSEFSIGYTFKNDKKIENTSVLIDRRGNTHTYTDMDLTLIKSHELRIGYFGIGMYNSDELDYSIFDLFHKINNISFGYSRTTSYNSKFNTDKFGKRSCIDESIWYYDLLFSLPSKFSYIELIETDNSSMDTPEVPSFISIEKQNEFRSNFRKLPLGFKMGFKTGGLAPHKFSGVRVSYFIEGGVYPGYYATQNINIAKLISLKMGLSFGFLKYKN